MVEDLNTEPYLVDTALNHLIRAGKLDDVAGLRVRHRRQPATYQTVPEGPESTLSIEEMLDELIAPARDPGDRQRARSATASTWRRCRSGATARLDGGAKTLEVIEAAVELENGRTRNGGS